MPQGMGTLFRKMVSGLLVLSVLLLSFAQAHAALPVSHDATVTLTAVDHDGTAGAVAPFSADDRTGSPCKGHDGAHCLACCFAGACSMMSGWLPVPSTVLSAIMPVTLVYFDASTTRPGGLRSAPALPPPRRIV
jgi:hypothetical protein